MGQMNTSQVQDYVPFFSQIINEENPTLLTAEIQNLTYEEFVKAVGDINKLCLKYLDSNEKQLMFAVKKGSVATPFWKATAEIACIKIDPETQKIDNFRLMRLSEFIKVFKTLTNQYSVAEQSSSSSVSDLTASQVFELGKIDSPDSSMECCICMERPHEVSLPCAHSFCNTCITEWNESHDTCPICRDKFENSEDNWVISEVPRAEEICEEIRANLSDLTNDRSPPCTPS